LLWVTLVNLLKLALADKLWFPTLLSLLAMLLLFITILLAQ